MKVARVTPDPDWELTLTAREAVILAWVLRTAELGGLITNGREGVDFKAAEAAVHKLRQALSEVPAKNPFPLAGA